MKHPKLSTLQDYFENELNDVQSMLLKNHLLDCDQCTLILSQMAKVDIKFKQTVVTPVSSEMKDRIFSDAKNILAARRKKIEAAEIDSKVMQDWFENMEELIKNTFTEFKAPVFQLASLSLIVGVIVTANQSEQLTINKPLSEEVVIYTHGETDSPVEGDAK